MLITPKFIQGGLSSGGASAWNDLGLAETSLTVPAGQDLIFVQRLRFEPAFSRLALNGRVVALVLYNPINAAYTPSGLG